MLIRSPDSLNVYRSASLVDHVDENGNLTEGEWRKNITGDTFYPSQTPLEKLSETNLKIVLSTKILWNGNGYTFGCICFNWRFYPICFN